MNKPLKVDLHIHTREDPQDRIAYSAYDLINHVVLRGFDALAITNHGRLTYSARLKSYAAQRGIVLIPGVEATIQGKHFLLLNMPFQNGRYSHFEDILKQKGENSLVIAPHPYFPGPTSLNGQLETIPHLFDAVEYCHFYSHRIDFNKEALQFAKKHQLSVVGSSDAHILEQLGLTYSLVEAEKRPDAIIRAIKAGRVKAVSRPLPLTRLATIFIRVAMTKRSKGEVILECMRIWRGFMKHLLDGRW